MRKQDLESKTCCWRIGPECDVSGGALPIFVTPIPAIRTYNACMTQSNQSLDSDQTKWEESCYGASHARRPIERDIAGENKNCDTNDDARSACWQKEIRWESALRLWRTEFEWNIDCLREQWPDLLQSDAYHIHICNRSSQSRWQTIRIG